MTYMNLSWWTQFTSYSILMLVVFVLASINIDIKQAGGDTRGNILQGLWGLVGSIVNPLICIAIPGTFYFYIERSKRVETENDSGLRSCCPPRKYHFAWLYAFFGLVLLPVYLTLATKNLFTTGQ